MDQDIGSAIEARRLHHQLTPNELFIESTPLTTHTHSFTYSHSHTHTHSLTHTHTHSLTHPPAHPSHLSHTAEGYPTTVSSYLRSIGHNVVTNSGFAVVQGILQQANGNITAHSDSRKNNEPGHAYLLPDNS